MVIEKNGRSMELGTGIPLICVPLVGRDPDTLVKMACEARESGCGLVEWRADFCQDQTAAGMTETAEILSRSVGDLPILFTIRTKEEGGFRSYTQSLYRELVTAVCASGHVQMADVEALKEGWDTAGLIAELKQMGIAVVASNHDFEKTGAQEELEEKFRRLRQSGAQLIKLAVMPVRPEDPYVLMKAVRNTRLSFPDTPVIAMSMGEAGKITRIRGEDFGSCLTFATAGEASAPGQIPAAEIRPLLEEVHRELALLEDCTLCPRECHVNRRTKARGYCGEGDRLQAARAALHPWEEPCLTGGKGSGTVFFSGCGLKCVYCQNRKIAVGNIGEQIEVGELAEIFLGLEEEGAANINLVTAAHFVPLIIPAVKAAREKGLRIPVVYNSGGYESVETIKRLEGTVDIYMPDYKYADAELAQSLSHAPDYPRTAMDAITEMVRQTGRWTLGEDGNMVRGTIVRHLVLPGHTRNSIMALKALYDQFGDSIYLSLMNQYTPMPDEQPAFAKMPELSRKVTDREFEKVVRFALELGFENGYFQEGDTAGESFIPEFPQYPCFKRHG